MVADRRVATTNTTTAVLVTSDRVPSDEFWVLDFAALYNESGESVTLQWCIVHGDTVIFVSADSTVADGKAVSAVDLPVLVEGEQFAARVTGSAKQGKVTMVLTAARFPEWLTLVRGKTAE
jgi:hypothetical protein